MDMLNTCKKVVIKPITSRDLVVIQQFNFPDSLYENTIMRKSKKKKIPNTARIFTVIIVLHNIGTCNHPCMQMSLQ